MKTIIQIITLPYLLIKSYLFWLKAKKQNLPGKEFYLFGKRLGRKLFLKGFISPKLLLNPVSIVRYFEFEFASKSFSKCELTEQNILDVSSPYLFGFYISSKFTGKYNYINPDKKDLSVVKKYASKINFKMNYLAGQADATKLLFEENSFSHIISISVIEHINGNGDSEAIKEMWRVLKPGGLLILTFPAAKSYFEEFTNDNTYGLQVEKKNNKFFFQRIYDETTIHQRLLNKITNFTILGIEIFGEMEKGFYNSYAKRWEKNSFFETVKDPFYISKYFKKLDSFSEIKDLAVIGLTLRKHK